MSVERNTHTKQEGYDTHYRMVFHGLYQFIYVRLLLSCRFVGIC